MSTKTPGAPRLRRTWPQRLFILFNVGCIVVALAGAGTLAYAKRKVNEINRIQIDSLAAAEDSNIDGAPRNFLIVGADSDDGLAENDPARVGRDGSVGGVRSDTIMVVRLDPASKQAKVLSFPRDLWVDIPGHGSGRINTPIQLGGPELLVETIKTNFDIDINHYVQVDFAGFQELVNLVGGVPVYFPAPVRDTQSGLDVATSGCTKLDENGALSYVRSRHFQHYDDETGEWVSDPSSDLGRISRQQDFIKRVLRRAANQGARNPAKLADFVQVAVENLYIDQHTTAGDIIDLGKAFRSFDPEALQTFSLPVSDAWQGSARVLDLVPGTAEPILQHFRGTGEAVPAGDIVPAAVAVRVLNGSGVQDQAAAASEILGTAGFSMSEPSSAPAVQVTEVRYPPGQEEEAALVARHLSAQAVFVPDDEVREITVVTGNDFVAATLEARPEAEVPTPTSTTTSTTTTTTVAGSSSSSIDGADPTTTTTSRPGYVPEAATEDQSCS